MTLPPAQERTIRYIVAEMWRDFFKAEVLPLDAANHAAIAEIGKNVKKLELAFARWGGAISILLLLLIGVEAAFSGACNKYRLQAIDSSVSMLRSVK